MINDLLKNDNNEDTNDINLDETQFIERNEKLEEYYKTQALTNDLPLDCFINGVKPEFKHQLPDGSLINADQNHVLKVKTKAKIAATAQLLATATSDEKTQWAIELKQQANSFYLSKQFDLAMECYLQCLVAGDFSSTEGNNVDEVIVPVLCNLSACTIELQDYNKSIEFSKEVLKLRPNCTKAIYRLGLSLSKIGNYTQSLKYLLKAKELENNKQFSSLSLTLKEKLNLDNLIDFVNIQISKQQKNNLIYKEKMKKAFNRKLINDNKKDIQDNSIVYDKIEPKTTNEVIIVRFFQLIKQFFIYFYNKIMKYFYNERKVS